MFSAALQSTGIITNNNVLKNMSTSNYYETLSVKIPKEFVYHVELNRPDKLNAFSRTMWM